MKQTLLFSLLFISIWSVNKTKAQSFSQGGLSVLFNISYTHDSSMCATNTQNSVYIMVNNAALNDTVRIVDQWAGFVVDSFINTTGQNPWNFMATLGGGYYDDGQVLNNNLYVGTTSYKFIHTSDTIYNANGFTVAYVPDACIFDTVKGHVYVDNNGDCIYNGTDQNLNLIAVQSAETLNSPASNMTGTVAYTDFNGNYDLRVLQSWMTSYTVSLSGAYPFMFPPSPCANNAYVFTTLPQNNVDFPVQCAAAVDVQAGALAPNVVRPAIPFFLHPYVSNIGCDSASGQLQLILDPHVTYNAALSTNPPNSVSGNTLTWNYSNLTNISNNGYWNSFFAGVHLTPDTSLQAGDTVCFTITSTIPTNDINSSNNSQVFCLPVLNSYDPNIKEVSPKGITANGNVPDSTKYLEYTVHFQNTGNAPAFTVDIADTLDSDIIPSSLRIISSTHNCWPRWTGNNHLRFTFSGINLPDSTSNEPASHGAVKFSVKLKNGLPTGTQIKNKASIYFDFNTPIVTNTALTTLGIPVTPENINDIDNNKFIHISPNPSTKEITIQFAGNLSRNGEVCIYNLAGQQCGKYIMHQNNTSINIEKLPAGIYFLKLNNGDKVYSKKFIKQ